MADEAPTTPSVDPSALRPNDSETIRDPHQITIRSIFWTTTLVALYIALLSFLFPITSVDVRWDVVLTIGSMILGMAPGVAGFYLYIGQLRQRAGLRRCLVPLDVVPTDCMQRFSSLVFVGGLLGLPYIMRQAALPDWTRSLALGAWFGLPRFFMPGKAAKILEVYERGLIWYTSLILWKDVRGSAWFGDLLRLRLASGKSRDFVLAAGYRERLTVILQAHVPAETPET